MSENRDTSDLILSASYRRSRTVVATVCGLSIAWSAAQIEFTTISLGSVGTLDMSNASIPLVFVVALGFMFSRLLVEFCMQPINVRRWALARTDLNLTLWLFRAAIVSLGIGALHRSIESLLVAVAVVVFLVIFALINIYIVMMLLMPFLVWLRKRQGRHSVASRANESYLWAEFLTIVILILSFILLGVASVIYEPISSLLSTPPSPVAAGIAIVAFVSVLLSIYLEELWYPKIVAEPPSVITEKMPDGTVRVTFGKQDEEDN